VQSSAHLGQADYANRWSRIRCSSHLAYTNKIRVIIGRQENTVMLCFLFCFSVRCKTIRESRDKWSSYGGISEDSSLLGCLAVPTGKVTDVFKGHNDFIFWVNKSNRN